MSDVNKNIILAEEYSKKKKYKKSIESWEKVLTTDPNFSTGWKTMGQVYEKFIQLEKWEKALECYEKALQINPQDADAKRWKDQLQSKIQNLGPEGLKKLRKEEKKRRKEKRGTIEIVLIASVICSLILGITTTVLWFLTGLKSQMIWLIPTGFLIGLCVPMLILIIGIIIRDI